jgi:hypothetical protein
MNGGFLGLFKDNNKYITFTLDGNLKECDKAGNYDGKELNTQFAVFKYETKETTLSNSYILINKETNKPECQIQESTSTSINIYIKDKLAILPPKSNAYTGTYSEQAYKSINTTYKEQIYQVTLSYPDSVTSFNNIDELTLYAPNLITYLIKNNCTTIDQIQDTIKYYLIKNDIEENVSDKEYTDFILILQDPNYTFNDKQNLLKKIQNKQKEQKKRLLQKETQEQTQEQKKNKMQQNIKNVLKAEEEDRKARITSKEQKRSTRYAGGGNLSNLNINYHLKYQKYKLKYLNLKSQKN